MKKIGIIGTGNISRSHIEGYLRFPAQCQIVALVDIYPERAQALKEKYQLDAAVFSAHKDILGQGLDLVSICTPPYVHASIAIDCLEAGINVLVEKPMATSLAECDAMIEARDRSGKLLSVIAQNRFRTPIMKLKQTLDSGLAGRVLHAQIDSFWWRGHCYYDLWWRGTWEKEGGGCTLNHAVHHIDMLGWMMGRPQRVSAMISNANHDNSEVEDVSVAVLQYGGGALAQLTSSVIHHGEEQKLQFQCEHAKIAAPWQVIAARSSGNGFPMPNEPLEQEIQAFYDALPELVHCGHSGQILDVLTALETGGTPTIDGPQGRATIELITAIYKAGTQRRAVDLPISPQDPFYSFQGILANVPRFHEKSGSVAALTGEITVGSNYDYEHI